MRAPGTRCPPPEHTEGALIAIRAVADEGLTLDAPSRGEHLTLTSQMLMPPSIPVVQNCEQLAFPPASTEIWLRGTKRQRGGVSLEPWGLPGPPPNLPRDAPGPDRSTARGRCSGASTPKQPQGSPEPNLSPPRPQPSPPRT